MNWRRELWENGTEEDRQWLLGRAIADQRERKGFSQKWVAEAMGFDPSAMSLIEKGKRRVTSIELWHFSQLFSVSPLVFFPDEPEEETQ